MSDFSKWKDEDFYGPKASHIFFYQHVDSASVQELRMQLFEASKPIKSAQGVSAKPKPIVIHLHSPGGDGDMGVTMANFLREIPVPVAVVVDGYACSAITPMLVSASYRVMHEFSFVMFHEGSVYFSHPMKENDASFMMNEWIKNVSHEYRRFYEMHTDVPSKVLDDMLSRDIFMNATNCKKYKVIDRVIPINKKRSDSRWATYFTEHPDMELTHDPLSWKVTLNHLYNYDQSKSSTVGQSPLANNLLKVISPMNSVMLDQTSSIPLPIVLHTNYYIVPRSYWFDIATLLVHTNIMRVPVIGVIDNNLDLLRAVPCIIAHRRYMYDNAYIIVRLVYDHKSMPSAYYHDIKYNTDMIRTALVKVLKQYTKMPASLLSTLFEERIMLSAKECKAYGLIDEIIPSKKKDSSALKSMKGGTPCSCSQGLSLNPPPGFDF